MAYSQSADGFITSQPLISSYESAASTSTLVHAGVPASVRVLNSYSHRPTVKMTNQINEYIFVQTFDFTYRVGQKVNPSFSLMWHYKY